MNRRALMLVGSALATLAIAITVVLQSADAATLTNTAPSGLTKCNPRSATITSACKSGALADFNRARAKEGLRPMVLPSNFVSLKPIQQLLVLTNLDRRARGRSAFPGLNATIDSYAQAGANRGGDPNFPSWTRQGGANWASSVNAFWTEFLWVYDDGIGSGNMSCTRTNTSGCWQHRRNVLLGYTKPIVFGAGVNSTRGSAALYLGENTHDRTLCWSWASEARYFPGGRLP